LVKGNNFEELNMLKRFNLLIFLTLLSAMAMAQEPRLVATAKTHVAVGEQFQVTFSLNTNGTGFKGPSFADFNVYVGPSMSSSVQIINGNFSQQIAYSYIISALKEGTYTIGPASITVNGKSVKSNSLTIEVSKGAPTTGGQGGGGTENAADKIFVRTELSRSKCFQGEHLVVTHKVYSRYQIVGFRDLDYPTYEGFWSQILEDTKQNIQLDMENIDGTNYYVATLRQSVLFPQRSGTLEVKPMSVEMVVRQKTKGSGDDFWDNFFGPSYKDVAYKVKGTSAKVEVAPLPASGRPGDFSGSVGTFSISARCDREKAKTNDAVSLVLTVSGKGNLKMLDAPQVNFPEGIDPYEPKLSDNISVTANGMSGTRTYEYTLLPRQAGEYSITVKPFSYFDPEKKAYVTLDYPAFPLSVQRSAKDQENVVVGPHEQQELTPLASDIRFIKTDMGYTRSKDDHFFNSWKFWSAASLPPLLFFVFFLARRKHLRDSENTLLVKSRKAGRIAQKRLSLANKHLLAGNKDLFYEEVLRAMNTYISDRLHLPLADLSRDKIAEVLLSRKAGPQLVAQITGIIETCEFARYAPAGSAVEMGNMYNDALDAIIKTEETLS
jgi:hypothetical protein